MKQHYIHTNINWSIERRDTLSLGYCFSPIMDVQGKPAVKMIRVNDCS